jgi:hypothetical protein
MPKINFIDAAGRNQEAEIEASVYREAAAANLKVPQYLAQKYPTDPDKYGSTFKQMCAQAGLFANSDPETGKTATSMASLFNAAVSLPNNASASPSNVLFPALMLSLIEDWVAPNTVPFENLFNSVIANTQSVNTPILLQPMINVRDAYDSDFGMLTDFAEPPQIMSITASSKPIKMPLMGAGTVVSNTVAQYGIDQLAFQTTAHLRGIRPKYIKRMLKQVLTGDTDLGIPVISGTNSSTYDATAVSAATFSHKAFLKWLWQDWETFMVDTLFMGFDTFLTLENRLGRPTVQTDDGTDARLNTSLSLSLPGIPNALRVFPVDDTIVGANTIIGIDSSLAIQRFVNVAAETTVMEQMALKRATAFMYTVSEICLHARPNAFGFKKLVIA